MSLSRAMMIIEAIHSVALEHDPTGNCLGCRAAHGDKTALAQVVMAIEVARRQQ